MNWRSIGLIFLALGFYVLPWLINPAVGLTANAYDLAEWASLHPEVRNQTPSLLTSLLLRVPLVIFGLMIALNIGVNRKKHLTWISLFLLVAVASFPPLEFLTVARSDPNYQQQFMLFLSTLIIGGVAISGMFNRWHWLGLVILGALGIGVSAWGLMQTRHLMIGFSMPVAVGLGGIGTSLMFLLISLEAFSKRGNQ